MNVLDKLLMVFGSMEPELSFLTTNSVYNQRHRATALDINWNFPTGYLRGKSLSNNVEQIKELIKYQNSQHHILVFKIKKKKWTVKVLTSGNVVYTAVIRFVDSSWLNEWAVRRQNPEIKTR